MHRVFWLLVTLVLGVPAALAVRAQSATARPDLAMLLERVGSAVERYFSRAQSVMCIEKVTLHSVGADLISTQSVPRHLTYELRISWEPPPEGGVPEATIQRQLLKVGGRPPRPKDKPGCTDPKEVSPEPLAFLLPGKQRESIFTLAGSTKVSGRPAVMVDFRSRETGPITSKETSEDCYSIDLPGRTRGRIWIDVETSDVLRLDERLAGIYDVTPAPTKRNRYPQTWTIERFDSSTVYRPVTFADPPETLLLPRSVETVQVIRNSGQPRLRKMQVFSDYRRFITGGRIIEQQH
jgi:hypothetical protein